MAILFVHFFFCFWDGCQKLIPGPLSLQAQGWMAFALGSTLRFCCISNPLWGLWLLAQKSHLPTIHLETRIVYYQNRHSYCSVRKWYGVNHKWEMSFSGTPTDGILPMCFFPVSRLANQRAKFLKDKMEEMQCYKRALDTQVKTRPTSSNWSG